MMYKSYKDLENKILECGDILIFDVGEEEQLLYEVLYTHLHSKNNFGDNEAVFKKLDIKDKEAFCSKAYGYPASSGRFPVAEAKNYEALTKVALALFKEVENKEDKLVMTESQNERKAVTWENLQVGDFVYCRNYIGDCPCYKVLARLGDIVFLSCDLRSETSRKVRAGNYVTQYDLEQIYTYEPPLKAMTLAEIEKKLGHKVKIVE